jgi:shikimate dehydrogenase
MNAISARTRVVCVIGDPITHSLSPAMHNAAFRHLGLDYAYVAFHVRPPQLKAAVAGFRALHIAGVNVTVPHKEKILPLLDAVSSTSRRTGAVNTVINRDGRLHGENTDAFGFRRALTEFGVELRGARVVVIGAGGAARAVLVALADARAAEVRLFNRTIGRARRLARLAAPGSMELATTPLVELRRADLGDVALVVNTTSLGLKGQRFPSMNYASSSRDTAFFDLIPKAETDFLRAARRARRRVLDGTGMLLHQGAAAFELWTGQPAPITIMRRALRNACA